MDQSKFYYVTAASGEDFIKKYTQYALKSLLKCGIDSENIYCLVNTKKDFKLIRKMVPSIENLSIINESLDHVKWKYMKGKRKFSYFKAAAMAKTFPTPREDKCLVCFDGDVLWYKNPTEFFIEKCNKTWFHHGKDLQKRCKVKKEDIDCTNYKSLCNWVDPALAYLIMKHKISPLPDREVVAGLYLLHPRDHEVLNKTFEFIQEITDKFEKDDSAGEQKPFNAALCYLNVNWHGGSRFFCPEHIQYFDHFFGAKENKEKFFSKIRSLEL